MSSRLQVIAYQRGHLDFITPKSVFNGDGNISARIAAVSQRSDSFINTIIFRGKPIALVGLVISHDGVAECWSLTSDMIKRCPFSFHRTVKTLIETYQKHLRLRRVQMTVRENYEEGLRWAYSLGFNREGLMYKYGPDGSNHYMLARVT